MGRIVVFLIVLLPILVSIKIAKDRRKTCAWDEAYTHNQWFGAFLMIALALLAGLQRADALSIFGIGRALLLWYGVYRMARAIYRKRDLKSQLAAAGTAIEGQVTQK
jgi:hypothetical protein